MGYTGDGLAEVNGKWSVALRVNGLAEVNGKWSMSSWRHRLYLFMDACPRAGLGKWIHQLRFSLKMRRISRMSANAAIENNNTAAASSAASANDGHEDEVPPPPPVKKRYLQKQLSDSSSDQEEKTLLEMINSGPYLQHRQNKLSLR